MKIHTLDILPKLDKIVSKDLCEKLALQMRFVIRSTSRLKGDEFAKAMILGSGDDSLNVYCRRIKDLNSKAHLSLPALAQRINTESSTKFMYRILIECLVNTYERGITKLPGLNRILIQDSTCIELNKKLANVYAGSGGTASKAAVKIDCIYDYTNENILSVLHCPRNVNDAQNADEVLKFLEYRDVVVRDLGYFKIEELINIEDVSAFYVSRLKSGVNVYLKKTDKKPVNFLEFIKKKLKKRTFIDCDVYVGVKKHKTRMIVTKLPDEIVNLKLRRAKRGAQVARTQLSQLGKALLSYTILITNIPRDIATSNCVLALYRIRWRVELLFKEWKSYLNFENIIGTNIHRINCLIFGRLCRALIMNKIISYMTLIALKLYNSELSIKKTYDILLKDGQFFKMFQSENLEKCVENFITDLKYLLKTKRKDRKTTREMVLGAFFSL